MWKSNGQEQLNPRKQLSVAGRASLMFTSILFWFVADTLPDSENFFKICAKIVSVLSFFNYATWTGTRGIIGTVDFVAVHFSAACFILRLFSKPFAFSSNLFMSFATWYAWKHKTNAEGQLAVHVIALINLFMFGLMCRAKS